MADYLGLIERKTAVLFGGCCELAGLLAEVDEVAEERLRQYGLQMGMAFQIVDDLLDFTGDPEILGKPTASDLREGKVTLPVIDLLEGNAAGGREIVERIARGDGRPGDGPELIALLHGSGAIERAEKRARSHADLALAVLDSFPDGPARRALQGVPELLISRSR
jgi:geranylgeranyl pyrophosphate synthase